ncbi:MAG: recombinase family protein [Candidatus Thiodiazotropha sp.]
MIKKRACIYARYSSDLQSDASIEDQIRLASEKAKSQGWEIVNCYTDAGISGASLMRPGIQALMQAAMNGEFDVLLAEALDRLSRDQEDIAGIFKRMEFAGVQIITLSEGEISSLHIGLKGTMNAMFLKDLADKTRRGLRGRVENGKSGGGLAYGYAVVKKFNADGEAQKGEREVVKEQAVIIRRIFEEYALKNKSPKAIADALNKEGIPAPSGKSWGQSTINGNRRRGTGILNNPLYIGELIWNRQRFIKDPSTGKRVTRLNDESQWIRQSMPDLRIVSQELWDAAKARQKVLDAGLQNLHKNNRPRYLLSGLLKCGCCGGGFAKINAERYGCSQARNKGESVCANKRTIKKETIESLVLNALQTRLMRDDLLKVFCEEYTRHFNALQNQQDQALKAYQSEQAKLAKERENMIQAIKDGVPADMIKDELKALSDRLEELETLLKTKPKARPLLHPSMAERYRREISDLRNALNQEETRGEAHEALRGLIEKIVLTPAPETDELTIDLHGSLAGILSIASQETSMNYRNEKRLRQVASNDNLSEPSVELVAGAGFEPTTFGL